ncbi:uncharacterized protein LOC134190924 [Corticium candelabrum]|uniref:uncharacterized protein LOC134190924 n=1 Tax=Corticium candelabrum TaxID=121492 RepID=UPI002E252282|nr:uncharacterized protein LOC134190924 [Corticium candelabrum]
MTTPEFLDLSKIKGAIADVRKDSSSTNWVLIGHSGSDPLKVALIASGSGGPSELASHVQDDQFMYGLIRLEETIDMSTTVKFVYIHWLGEDVPFAKKGRFGVVHGSIREQFQPFHGDVETGNRDDLEESNLMTIIQESSGTKSKVLEKGQAENRQERSFTAGGGAAGRNSKPVGSGTRFIGVQGAARTGGSMKFSDEVKSAIAGIRDDGTDANWCAAGYEDGDVKKAVVLLGSGNEGLPAIKDLLKPDIALYALLRVTDVVDEISTVKFVFIQWVGEEVKPMAKAKISTHKAEIGNVFLPAHVSVFATSSSDITEREIMGKVQSASGSKSHVK